MDKGFGFIELLLCCLLFSLCMIGAISCQLYARQQVISAHQRLQATALLTDVLSAMQGSPSAVDIFRGQFEQVLPPQPACRRLDNCDAATVASSQLNQQLMLLFSGNILPDARLCVAGTRWQPELHLSWLSPSTLSAKPNQPICAVAAGRQFVEISAQAFP